MSFVVLASYAAPVASPPPLWGLALVANGPAKAGLVTLDPTTGKHKSLGPPHSELFGESDMAVMAKGAVFYLGDTSGGATLVALNATDGTEICNAHVDVAEIKFVGLG